MWNFYALVFLRWHVPQIGQIPFPRPASQISPHSGCAAVCPFIVFNSSYVSVMLYLCVWLGKVFGWKSQFQWRFFFFSSLPLKIWSSIRVSYTKFFSVNIWNQSKTWLFHLISHVLFDVACFSNPVSLPSEAAPQRTQRFQYWSWRSTEGHLTNATLSPSRSSWKFFNVFLFFCERT